jgi:hypothetical protein
VTTVGVLALLGIGYLLIWGWSTTAPMTTSDPPAKVRLLRLGEKYLQYVNEKGKAPPNEAALLPYLKQYHADDLQFTDCANDPTQLLISPRDGKKFVIRYGLGTVQRDSTPLAWESQGEGGQRFVFQGTGYVEEINADERLPAP